MPPFAGLLHLAQALDERLEGGGGCVHGHLHRLLVERLMLSGEQPASVSLLMVNQIADEPLCVAQVAPAARYAIEGGLAPRVGPAGYVEPQVLVHSVADVGIALRRAEELLLAVGEVQAGQRHLRQAENVEPLVGVGCVERVGQAAEGIDPLEARDARRAIPTVGEWIDSYLVEVERRKKHPRADRRYLGMARKRWGHRPLDSLTVEDMRRAMSDASEGHPIRGNRWLASVRACLNTAWRADLIASNPASRIRPNRENPPRARVLSDEELRRVSVAIDEQPDPFVRLAFLLLLATGARCSEVLRAQWADIDLDAGTWRIPSPKSGRPQMIPLSVDTVAMLRAAPRMLGTPWLLPGRDPERHRADLDRQWRAIRESARVPDVHIHDLRRTFGLHVARTAGLHIASKLLRHATVTVTEQVYAPLGLEDLRAGLETMQRARAKVIPIRKFVTDGTA